MFDNFQIIRKANITGWKGQYHNEWYGNFVRGNLKDEVILAKAEDAFKRLTSE